MLTLGIDTSTRVSSVALCDGEKILGEVDINVGMTHSEGLNWRSYWNGPIFKKASWN